MPRYKRADFDEDDASSAGGFNSDLTGFINPNATQSQQLLSPSGESPTGSVSIQPMITASQISRDNLSSPPGISFFGSSTGKSFGLGSGGVGTRKIRKRNLWDRASPLEKFLLILTGLLGSVIIILISVLAAQTKPKEIELGSLNRSDEYCLTPACVTVASAIINAMDTKINPCDDFYQYACGGWIKSNPLPDGKSIWGTFGKLWQENQLVMKNVLEDEAESQESKAERKARTYYKSCLDKNETMELLGPEPMQEFIEKIGGWNVNGNFDVKNWDFNEIVRRLHCHYNRGGLFSWAVGADERNSSHNIIQLDQGGLGLPSRDYYLNKSSNDEVLKAYLSFMTKVGVLLGGDENSTRAQMEDVIEFETKLANITIPADERRDDERAYNKWNISRLSHEAPAIRWLEYFQAAFNQVNYTIKTSDHVVIYSPSYFSNMSKLLNEHLSTEEGKIILANYLVWSVVQPLTSSLSKPFREASKILRKALIGSEGSESTWRYCVTDTNSVLGFALGAMFVNSVFHGDSKPMAETMIKEIKDAFKDNLPNLKWMDPETKKLAEEKADAISDMIGFPDFILNPQMLDKKYNGLNFKENTYFENNIKVNIFSFKKNIEKITKPANRSEWEMTPPTVNAYYTPTKNQIVFPAGILQAPFYDVNYPKSLNFGAMGVVMGHELTHAFDDQGREYDKNGNLHQWWRNSTIKNFDQRVKCFTDQYSSYHLKGDNEVLEISGKQTVGENIADNGGLKAAFHAYEGWMKSHDEELPLPGVNLTNRQLFFMGFAQVWCSITTPEAQKLEIFNDPHSPPQFRVIGTLSNSREFAEEFNCPKDSSMNPGKKCEIW